MFKNTLIVICLITSVCALGQTKEVPLHFETIPDYPEKYSAGSVAARMVDGLGFRFYWATEGLRPQDLEFRPGEEMRSIEETIDHIYSMSVLILNAVKQSKEKTIGNATYEMKRAETLKNLKTVRDVLIVSSDDDFDNFVARFGKNVEFPFWNLVNGPIADMLWHCGQVVSFRRSAGNPFNSQVSVFTGRLRDQ
ncbi:MAG: hypothetical protein ABJH05_11600 [Fulvivirga sp.]